MAGTKNTLLCVSEAGLVSINDATSEFSRTKHRVVAHSTWRISDVAGFDDHRLLATRTDFRKVLEAHMPVISKKIK
jgi:hypothetical protein